MSEILILVSITLLAAISPGPDMVVVLKNALRSSSLGYMTALGVGLAIFFHVAYCIAGVGLIISQSIILFTLIKTLGALYLLYIAYQLFLAKRDKLGEVEMTRNTSLLGAFREGFMTNILNPKATLFFLSVFTQVISPDTSIMTQSFYGMMMAGVVGSWFMIFTTIINFSFVKNHIAGVQYYLNKCMGGLLVFLGIKILLSTK